MGVSDALVVSDTGMPSPDVPSLCIGLRGLCGVEVHVRGPRMDLHSGEFGGAVANPVDVLARIIAGLHDPLTGMVTVPGFYDGVRLLTDEERSALARMPYSEEQFRAEIRCRAGMGGASCDLPLSG